MCGIAGIITKPGKVVNQVEARGMQDAIYHRGPDGGGAYMGRRVALLMRRLSIIDVSGGDQPLYNEDKSIVVIGNGEIYNYIELQAELKKKHRLRTKSDIETIAHLYEDYGLEGVKKLRGMFALALFDRKKGKVLLIRDRLGEKPIYWTKTPTGIVFASEMKAIIKAKGVRRKLNVQAINKFLNYFYVPEPETMFEGVYKLPPGHLLEINLKDFSHKEIKYWSAKDIETKSQENPTEKILNTFKESCLLTLRSDVPVGISLSGGIDSGAILSFAAPAYKDRMKAFSIGYEGRPNSDEREMAKKLAKKFKVDFIEKEIGVEEVINHFPSLVWDMDDPIADIAGHSIYSVNKLARENGIKVLLGGLGGDELFWGYPWTSEAVKKSLDSLNSNSMGAWLKKLMGRNESELMTFYQMNPGFNLTATFTDRVLTKTFKQERDNDELVEVMRYGSGSDEMGVARKGLDLIRDVWLLSNCIDLGDRLSMAASVEQRSPFLDYRLAEVVLENERTVMGFKKSPKYWFKKAMKGVLPDEVMNRPKRGFTPPVGDWIKGIIKRYSYLLNDGFLVGEGIIDKGKVKWINATWMGLPVYWYAIYQLLLLEIWGRGYYYGEKVES